MAQYDLEIRGALGSRDDSDLVRADDIVDKVEADRARVVPYRVLLCSSGGEVA